MIPRRGCSAFLRVAVFCAWLGVALCFSIGVSFAAVPEPGGNYFIDVWTTEKGLPNSSVTSIAQTPDGYLWVGTYNGLARFDGSRFVTFEPENTPELLYARIRKLFLDAQGTLWINTYDGSLTSLRNGTFKLEWRATGYADLEIVQAVSKPDHVTFLLPTGDLIRRDFAGTNGTWRVLEPPEKGLGTSACEDKDGLLWYRGRDGKLSQLIGNQFVELPVTAGGSARSLTSDLAGRIWVGTERGISAWAGDRFEDMLPTNGPPTLVATIISHSRDGGVWVLGNERLRKCVGRQWLDRPEPWAGLLGGGSLIRLGIHEQADGTEWFHQYGLGLAHTLDDGSVHRFTSEEGMSNDRVDCFFEDSERNFWVGTTRGGLVRLREKRFQVVSVADGSKPAAIATVCEDPLDGMWLGTMGGGIARWQDGRLSDFADAPGGGGRGLVFSAYPGAAGQLWLSAGDEDLYVLLNRRLELCVPLVHGVKAILASRNGQTVWAGTKSGLFVCSNGVTRVFARHPGIPSSADIRALAEGADGVLWAGGGNGTLYRVTTKGAEYFEPSTNSMRYPIWSLHLDDDGTVWVGTFRGGLLRYRDGKFSRFSVASGLPDKVIAQLLSDDQGNLWVGSHQGVFRVARSAVDAFAKGEAPTIPCTVYGRQDGLPSLECSGSYQPACWRARDGRLWFATQAGAVAIQPGDVTQTSKPPPVVIEEVLIDGVVQDLKNTIRRASLTPVEKGHPLELLPALDATPGTRQVEFRFTGLSFNSQARFRYKLVGLDKDWVDAGPRGSPRGTVQYGFLRPGDYQFQVTACNNEGVWNETGAALILRVRPYFYETKAFIIFASLAAAGLLLLIARAIYQRRLREELQRVERQRAVERDRARIAKDIHDDLGAGLTQITLLSELVKRDSAEEVEGHVVQISGTARELTRAMDEIVWAIDPQNDTLEGLITYVSKFAQQYLTVAGMRCRLDVPTELPLCVLGAEVRHNLYLAIKEALNNVVKHSQATVASLRLEYVHGTITLTIEDDGCGLARAAKNPQATRDRTSSGHGLGNMKRRLEDMGGRCEVSSEPAGGTKVQFTIHVPPGGSPVLATGLMNEGERL